MQRRLTIAIVTVVAGALLVAGLGTLALERQAAASAARNQIRAQARALAEQADFAIRPRALTVIRAAARLSGARTIPLGPDGALLGRPPSGLTVADLGLGALLAGQVTSGTLGNLAFAAVRIVPTQSLQARLPGARSSVLVITRRFSGPSHGSWYLVGALAATLAVAALVAAWMGRRITRPLAEAVAGTRAIAAGNLEARVPPAPGSYPELASLTSSINSMAAALSRSRGLERHFLLSVSHDLRTPLTSIRGFAEAIADGTATDPVRAATVISAESRRLERLVKDLLELARLDARHFSLDMRSCEVGEILADTAEGFRPLVDEAGLALTVSLDHPVAPDGAGGQPGLWVQADPDRLAQILANLLENAYKFASRQLTVRSVQRGSTVLVSVMDDGPGIPSQDLPAVFQRLYQSARAPARQAGSGLGLAIVAELARAMGAAVEVRSPLTATGGTEVVVSLAAAAPPTSTGPLVSPRPA